MLLKLISCYLLPVLWEAQGFFTYISHFTATVSIIIWEYVCYLVGCLKCYWLVRPCSYLSTCMHAGFCMLRLTCALTFLLTLCDFFLFQTPRMMKSCCAHAKITKAHVRMEPAEETSASTPGCRALKRGAVSPTLTTGSSASPPLVASLSTVADRISATPSPHLLQKLVSTQNHCFTIFCCHICKSLWTTLVVSSSHTPFTFLCAKGTQHLPSDSN